MRAALVKVTWDISEIFRQKAIHMNGKYMAALILAATAAGPVSAQNSYNANISGRVVEVLTYTEDATVLFTIDPMPTSPQCGDRYFRISRNLPLEMRQQVFSRLMAAYMNREVVNIGYDNQTCSPEGSFKVFRVG